MANIRLYRFSTLRFFFLAHFFRHHFMQRFFGRFHRNAVIRPAQLLAWCQCTEFGSRPTEGAVSFAAAENAVECTPCHLFAECMRCALSADRMRYDLGRRTLCLDTQTLHLLGNRTGQTSTHAPHMVQAVGRSRVASRPNKCGEIISPIGPG